jgi:hypothetical protein
VKTSVPFRVTLVVSPEVAEADATPTVISRFVPETVNAGMVTVLATSAEVAFELS